MKKKRIEKYCQKYSIANTLKFDERILEIESFIEEFKMEKEIDLNLKKINEEMEENDFHSYFMTVLFCSFSYVIVTFVSFLITLLFLSFHYQLIIHSLNFKPQNTQTTQINLQ